MDQLNIFVQQTTCVVKKKRCHNRSEENDCYCCCSIFLLRSIDANCCLFVLFVVREEAIYVLRLHTSVGSLFLYSLLLNITIRFFFSSLLSHASTIYSRSSCVRIRLVDDNGRRRDFPPFSPSVYVKRKTREGKEKE